MFQKRYVHPVHIRIYHGRNDALSIQSHSTQCSFFLIFSSLCYANNIGEDLMVFFKSAGLASNVTTPGAYQDQSVGFYTGGSIVARNRVQNVQLAHLQLPG